MKKTVKFITYLFLVGVFGMLCPGEGYSEVSSLPSTAGGIIHKAQGDLYLQEGKASLAMGEYRQAIELNYRTTDTYFNLAIASYSERDIYGAVSALENVVRLDPSDTESLYNLGCLKLYQQDKEEAVKYFERAKQHLHLEPRLAPHLNQAFEFLRELDQTDHSAQELILQLLHQSLPAVSFG